MRALIATALAVSVTASAAEPPALPGSLASPLERPRQRHGCLPTGNGYLRARIRGALALDVNLRDRELECDGDARPDGHGIRVSFAGPLRTDGRRLRMVFGIGSASEGRGGHALPVNLTVIFEGEQRLFATRGDDKCTIDELTQQRLGGPGNAARSYRIVARGFCIAPVPALAAGDQILINSFDFAGSVSFAASDEAARPAGRNHAQ
jgi:hypothetical protein